MGYMDNHDVASHDNSTINKMRFLMVTERKFNLSNNSDVYLSSSQIGCKQKSINISTLPKKMNGMHENNSDDFMYWC